MTTKIECFYILLTFGSISNIIIIISSSSSQPQTKLTHKQRSLNQVWLSTLHRSCTLDETLTTYADLERSQSYLGSVNVSCDTPDYRTWTDAQRFSAFITHVHAKGVLSCHAYERVVGFCAITRTRTRSTMPTV